VRGTSPGTRWLRWSADACAAVRARSLLTLRIACGVVAEWASYEESDLDFVVADFTVGCVVIASGIVAWDRRLESCVGALMSLTRFMRFLGTMWAPALFLHRGPLVHRPSLLPQRASAHRPRTWCRPSESTGEVGRSPNPVETTLFFVRAEAIANVAKHAGAARATMDLKDERGRVSVTIVDDGVGGAEPRKGSGLRGLPDGVEALGACPESDP